MDTINIAIVEDEEECMHRLFDFCTQYEQEEKVRCVVHTFKKGLELLADYKPVFDVIFMDIEMPVMNGMETAKYIRKIDKETCLIFVTRMSQYAIKGYEVNALDFMVKPITYTNFALKMKRVIEFCTHTGKFTSIKTEGSIKRVFLKDIYYVEVRNHELIYHNSDGNYSLRGSLSDVTKALRDDGFARCNNCYLVNMARVKEVKGNLVLMENGDELVISRPKHSEFIQSFSLYLGSKY